MERLLKVGTVPGMVKDVVVTTGMTVKQVLALADLNPAGFELKLNGQTVQESDTIKANSNTLFLVAKVKGNAPIQIKIGTVPGVLTSLVVESGTTVKQALELARLNPAGFEIKVNGATSNVDKMLTSDNTNVFLVAKVKGNR